MALGLTLRGWRSASPARRRGRRFTLAMVLAAALALLLPSTPASTAPAVPDQEIPPGLLPDVEWTELQANWLVNLVRNTERELPAFEDTARLQELGFVNIGVTAPGGYDHWTNMQWVNDGHILNPKYPESLVFQRTADGGYEIQAAMYLLPSHYTMDTIPSLISWIYGWHAHPELCGDETGRIVGFIAPGGTCSRGEPVLIPMIHTWVVDNACGHRFGGVDAGGLHCDYHDH